jgi:hypothetical protein
LKRIDHPNFFSQLQRINDAERIAPKRQSNLEYSRSKPCIGFARSDFPPSAAIVKAARKIDLAASGKLSNSLSAALIQETGRVLSVMGSRSRRVQMLSYMTTTVNYRFRIGFTERRLTPLHKRQAEL